jgi:hypothetical protein
MDFEAEESAEHESAETAEEEFAEEGTSSVDEALDILEQYWPARPSDELWKTLEAKKEEFHQALNRRGFFALYRLVYSMYFGIGGTSGSMPFDWSTQTMSFAGDDGELVELNINELRGFYDQVTNMVTKTRPAFQAQATNTDYRTFSQLSASDITVKYLYEQVYGEKKEKAVVEREVRYGKAYTHLEWDPDAGRDVEVPTQIDTPMGPIAGPPELEKSGEICLSALYPWDVICEPYRSEVDGHNWRLVKKPNMSKWEAVARWPKLAKRINDSSMLGDKWESMKPGYDPASKESADSCSVHIFYHARTPALRKGRHVIFINDIAVYDEELPFDEIPVYPLMTCELDRTSFGTSEMWNIIPPEQMMNQVLSDMATNIDAFGRPPLALVEGTDIDLDSLANGQTVLFIPANTQTPETVKFPSIPDISPRLVEMMRHLKQSASGVNAVYRGDTSSNITSGAHAALYAQTAVENQNPRQTEVDLHREKVANGILKALKRFAKHPQIVSIAGVDERAYLQEFGPDDWDPVQRITMKVAHPALRTIAGRLQIVELLRDWPGQPLKDPQRIIDLISSGQMKPLTDPMRVQELSVRWENERLAEGPEVTETQELDPNTGEPFTTQDVPSVPVNACDNVATHLIGHLEVVYSPAARANPAILKAALAHIRKHLDVARKGDPFLATVLGNPAPPGVDNPSGEPGNNGSGPDNEAVKNAAKVTADVRDDSGSGPRLPQASKPG